MKTKKILDLATKSIKDNFMGNKNKSDKSKHADTVIKNHILWSMGVGFLPPVADIIAASAVQLDMIRQLCRVYDVEFSETSGKAIVSSLTSSTLAKLGASTLIPRLVKLIPVVGNIIGGITIGIFNGASSYALGEVFKKHFESGGTILDFDTERFKKMYNEKFEKGKKVAEQLQKDHEAKVEASKKSATIKVEVEPKTVEKETAKTTSAKASSTQVLDKLRELGDLRTKGIISEEEFEQMKRKLIESF